MDHGLGYVEALFVIAHETAPFCHPAEGSLDDPAPRQDLEAGFMAAATDDFQHEVAVRTGIEQFGADVSAIAEQMLEPGLPFSDGGDNLLNPSTVGDVGRGQVQHEKAAIRIYSDVPFAAFDALAGVVSAVFGGRRLDRLAVHNRSCRALLPSLPLPVQHQGHVVDGAEQKQPDKTAEPPVHRLPGRKIMWQHPPAAARARKVAQRIQDFA